MKTTFKIILSFLTIIWFNTSCSSDDSLNDSKGLFVVNDFTVTIDENPTHNQLIGTIPFQVEEDLHTVRFFFTSQNVSNAISFINNSLYVSDTAFFDFESNPIIVANVKVEQGGWAWFNWVVNDTKTITVTINLNDLPD